MILTYPCRICGEDATTSWKHPQPDPTHHPECDTRPPGQRDRPHPKAGHLASAAHDLTLLLAAAAATPEGSPQWQEFDRQADVVGRIQRNNLHVDLAKAAGYYATTLGWPVFPLHPGQKRPLTRHGFKEATNDPAQVAAWWRQWPEANIGVPTGHYFDVVDIDTPKNWEVVDRLMDSDLKVFGVAHTSGGGLHLLVPPWEGDDNPGNQVKAFGANVDYRTEGGYIVAPWSRTVRAGLPAYWSWISPPANKIRR